MINDNQNEARLLGMPFGTANNRLRKKLLFHFAKELGMDICFKCKRKIVDIDDVSIEHKESWRYADDPIAAFFNVHNVAFSHLKCNTGARRSPRKKIR